MAKGRGGGSDRRRASAGEDIVRAEGRLVGKHYHEDLSCRPGAIGIVPQFALELVVDDPVVRIPAAGQDITESTSNRASGPV